METLASFYVDVIEPMGKILLLFMAVMTVIWFINVLKDPGKQMDMANQFFQFLIGLVVKTAVFTFKAVAATFVFTQRMISVIFGTLRDFFMSKI